jgi:hypothetical protein
MAKRSEKREIMSGKWAEDLQRECKYEHDERLMERFQMS